MKPGNKNMTKKKIKDKKHDCSVKILIILLLRKITCEWREDHKKTELRGPKATQSSKCKMESRGRTHTE